MFGARPFGTRGFGDVAGHVILWVYELTVDDVSHGHRVDTVAFANPEYVSGGFGTRPLGTRGFGDTAGQVAAGTVIYPDAFEDPTGFGAPRLWPAAAIAGALTLFGEVTVLLLPAGFGGEQFGTPLLANETFVLPEGFDGGNLFGQPTLYDKRRVAPAVTLFGEADTPVGWHINPPSLPVSTVFPSPRVLHAYQIILDDGIPTAEAVGLPRLVPYLRSVPACLGGQPTVRYVPVSFGAPHHLCGCSMPNGKALMVWCDGQRVRSAVLSKPSDWLQNGVVSSAGQTTTLLTKANEAFASSCFTDGTDVFFAALWRDNRTYGHQIFKADDPTQCTSFSLHAELFNGSPPAGDPIVEDIFDASHRQCGIPFIDGNTWLYPGSAMWWWRNPAPPASNPQYRTYARASLWHSSNGGVSMTQKIHYGYYDILLAPPYFTRFIGPQVHVDPQTGFAYWATAGVGGGSHWWESRDGGNDWTGHDSFGTTRHHGIPFADCENELYYTNGQSGQVYTVVKVGNLFVSTAEPVDWLGPNNSTQTKLAVTRPPGSTDPYEASIYCFIVDSVQGIPAILAEGGWVVGSTVAKEIASGWQ